MKNEMKNNINNNAKNDIGITNNNIMNNMKNNIKNNSSNKIKNNMKNYMIGKHTVIMIAILLLAGVFSLFASSEPDGLERVAIDSGFIKHETSYWTMALFPDYKMSAWADNWMANSFVGVLGALLMFVLIWGIGKWLVKGEKAIGKI